MSLNLSGFPSFDSTILEKFKRTIPLLFKKLRELESGEIAVNTTEGRKVDHYNLRMETEKDGKSLSKSLKQWEEIKKIVDEYVSSGNFTDVVLNGIGGSILGPVMMIIAMKGPEFYYRKDQPIRMHFSSNTDPDSFAELMKNVDLKKTILVTMSKSGGTAETMTNFEVFNRILKEKGGDVTKQNICITTEGSKLWNLASEMGFSKTCFSMNVETGGRTSVGSAIGMVPAAFSGIDFSEFLRGESEMDRITRLGEDDPTVNPALLIALSIHEMTKRNGPKNAIVLGYSDFLKEFAHYLQQLYMESLGKEYGINGVPVMEGQTVFGGIGTGEQHAFMQQIQKGISDCFVRFVYFEQREHDFEFEKCGSMGRQLLGFLKGTEHALIQNKKPFMTSIFEKRDLFNLGAMIALEERIVTFLGFLKGVNAYDQPGVELGKASANLMNDVSLLIEKNIHQKEKGYQWEGDALKAIEEFQLQQKDFPIYFVDSVLRDITANVQVKNVFPLLYGKIKASKQFKKGRFIYKIEKL